MSKRILIFFATALVLCAPYWQQPLVGGGRPPLDQSVLLLRADSLFQQGAYQQAFTNYLKAENPSEIRPEALFRVAYSAYKAQQYQYSLSLFKNLYQKRNFLNPFSHYFYIRSLWKLQKDSGAAVAGHFIRKYGGHPLADSLLLPLAQYYYDNGIYDKALQYFRMIKCENMDFPEQAEVCIKTAYALQKSGRQQKAQKAFFQIIKKYPRQKATLYLVGALEQKQPEFFQRHFWDILEVYIQNRRYAQAEKQLKDFVAQTTKTDLKERARFNLIRLYYIRGKFRTALYGLKNMLKNLHNKKLEPHIRLYTARCYRRLGMRTKAVEVYLDYADRYPRRRLAAEVVWKSAWLYERIGDYEQALTLYRLIARRWRRSQFGREAKFREGFTLYRLGHTKDALQVFNEIRRKKWDKTSLDRAQYWSAYCLAALGQGDEAKRLQVDLAANLWDDYYTLRSYLWHKSYMDTVLHLAREFRESPNLLVVSGKGLSRLMSDFERAFLVRELLGETYGLLVLKNIKSKVHSREEWLALAEIYKKFSAYGEAYRTYDWINRRYFSDMSYIEKAFMLKERFPFYYDGIVQKYAKRYGLEKELIMGLIKQESAFRSQVVSHANAYGLMQLMPFTAKDMARLAGVTVKNTKQLFDPEVNIHLGSLYLKQLDRQFDGEKMYMLAAYNAGPHRVKRWRTLIGANHLDIFIENIEFSETRHYVKAVLKNYWAYKLLNSNFTISNEELLSVNDWQD